MSENKKDFSIISQMLKVIAEPKRLEILSLLLQGTFCNCELGDRLNMAPNLISHHLKVLHEAGLVEMERDPVDARWIYYTINPASVTNILAQLTAFFELSDDGSRTPACGPSSKLLASRRFEHHLSLEEAKVEKK